jgi:predicted CXXCH cytochrome family protein
LYLQNIRLFDNISIVVLVLLILLVVPLPSFGSIKSAECIECHLPHEGFQHGGKICVDCHADTNALPHKEKLSKPLCRTCHQDTVKIHSEGAHGKRNVACKNCHNTHFIDKEKKGCGACHLKTPHISLPSPDKHLRALNCLACHSKIQESSIKIVISAKDRDRLIKKEVVDLDNNNTLDRGEWDHLNALLIKSLKGNFRITKEFSFQGNVHGITAKPSSCKACHIDRRLFGQARLRYTGTAQFEIPADPTIFIPETPSIESYRKTVHGRKGVQCFDCHVSQASINDAVCIQCHEDVYGTYKHTIHARKGATQCTDCHNPHRIEPYKELNVKERLAVCSRCHKDYVQKHNWLPNTILHFGHLECSTCHSPESTKSMVFYLSTRKGDQEEILSYENLESFFKKNASITPLLDKNGDGVIDSKELANFFTDVRKKLAGNAIIESSIIVTSVYHDYSVKRQKERICGTCHSEKAPFYESMFFILPEKGYHIYIPVKGTILSATPVSVFIDISLLSEQKATWADVKGFFSLKRGEFPRYAKELGFKWIDIIGIGLALIILFFILIHIAVRILVKR